MVTRSRKTVDDEGDGQADGDQVHSEAEEEVVELIGTPGVEGGKG